MSPRRVGVLAVVVLLSLGLPVRPGLASPGPVMPRLWLPLVLGPVPNRPPYTPSSPSPSDQGYLSPTNEVTLDWTGGDPDGDDVIYTVYLARYTFGGCFLAPLCQHLSVARCKASGLLLGATYCWRVDAVDSHGMLTQGPSWLFTIQHFNPPR